MQDYRYNSFGFKILRGRIFSSSLFSRFCETFGEGDKSRTQCLSLFKAGKEIRSQAFVAFAVRQGVLLYRCLCQEREANSEKRLLNERQQFLELLSSRAAQQFVHHHLGGGDDCAGGTHAVEP